MIGVAWWIGIAAGVAGVVAAYSGHWRVAVCAVIVGRPGK